MRKRTIVFIISTILALSLATNYWFEQPQVIALQQINPTSADYFFEGITVSQFNQQGVLVNQLLAKKLEHFRDRDSSTVTTPLIKVLNNDGNLWEIFANHGEVDHQGNLIELNDSVVIKQIKTILPPSNITDNLKTTQPAEAGKLTEQQTNNKEQKTLVTISTESLVFDLTENTAFNQATSQFLTENSQTTANAIEVNFKSQRVLLTGAIESKGLTYNEE